MSGPSEKRKTLTRRSRTVLNVLMALCVAGIVAFAWLLISSGREYSRGDDTYEQIRAEVFAAQIQTGTGAGGKDAGGGVGSGEENGAGGEKGLDGEEGSDGEDDSAGDKQSDQTDWEGGVLESPHPSLVNFDALRRVNGDIVGWIVGGETIDYPIVQGRDNDYYLSHMVNHERNRVGSIFMDYRNQGDFSDRATVIYGHNMKNGSMFASLAKYKTQSYYDRFRTMELYTPSGDYTVELFAGRVIDGNDEAAYSGFTDWAESKGRVDSLKAVSTFRSDTVVEPGDRMVILSTCSYESGNARYVVFGRLVPVGWSKE